MTHTPGPWVYRDVAGAGRQIYGNPGRMKVEGMTETTGEGPVMLFGLRQQPETMFAFDRWVQFPTKEWEAMQEANARLIAAAPDLLAALEECVRRCWSGSRHRHDDPVLQQAKAAIAKAKGGA